MKSLGRWVAIIVAVIVIAWLSYRLGQGNLSSQAGTAAGNAAGTAGDTAAAATAAGGAQAVPTGWTTHQDPAGFAVALPKQWQARAASSGRVEISGPAGERVVIWPVFISAAALPASAGPGKGAPFAAVLGELARRVFPNANWQMPAAAGTGLIRQFGRDGDSTLVANFVWVSSPQGVAGAFYGLTAPASLFEQERETFARILESFQATGPPASQQPSQPKLQYVRWSDPKENAFSLEVPVKWTTEGGLFRFAPVDTRTALSVTSPDGAVRITAGDSHIPTFTVPNQTLAFGGFTEGSWYSPGYGVQMMVRRFVPGAAFAAEYVQSQFGQSCRGLSIEQPKDRPDAVEAINRVNAQYGAYGMSIQTTAGEVTFGCSGEGSPLRGYYYATTQLTQGYGSGLWSVPYLYGYLAPQDREDEARQALSHMIETVEINPQWAAMQQNITANTSAIVTETNRAITHIINQTFQNTQSVNDEISRRRSNANRGVVDVIDEQTGRQIQVESGSNYYWIDQRGNIVGTDVYNRPTIDFREMVQLP